MRTTKALRDIKEIARRYDLEFDGHTAKGHFRWRHRTTGRRIITVSSLTAYKGLRNTERDFRNFSTSLDITGHHQTSTDIHGHQRTSSEV